jgi:hypothetical protein
VSERQCDDALLLCAFATKNKRLFCFVVVYSGGGDGRKEKVFLCVRFSFFGIWVTRGVSSAMAACLGLVSCSLLSSLSGPLGWGAFPSLCDGLFTLLVNCTRLA